MTDDHRDPAATRITFDGMAARAQYEWQRAEDAEAECRALARQIETLREALRKIVNCGQSEEPDHWKFRCTGVEHDGTTWGIPPTTRKGDLLYIRSDCCLHGQALMEVRKALLQAESRNVSYDESVMGRLDVVHGLIAAALARTGEG